MMMKQGDTLSAVRVVQTMASISGYNTDVTSVCHPGQASAASAIRDQYSITSKARIDP